MILLTLDIENLNESLQVGDLVFTCGTSIQVGAIDPQANTSVTSNGVGEPNIVGVLRKIAALPSGQHVLYVDGYNAPKPGDYLMFSKFEQGDSGVLGYYAKAKFENNSTEKAELFAVSSEIIINSK
tara:strand:+ start:1215 stop:1592 length:378 start_codon:yes stop_codon:yes gene_type:complete